MPKIFKECECCVTKECEQWFEEGAEFGFGEMETLVPPPGAAEMVKEWLEEKVVKS
jgi:hypothetical protein